MGNCCSFIPKEVELFHPGDRFFLLGSSVRRVDVYVVHARFPQQLLAKAGHRPDGRFVVKEVGGGSMLRFRRLKITRI